ncbi:MAG: hypothetical protein AAGM22_23030, partial [Acidobacteriota bacterium]
MWLLIDCAAVLRRLAFIPEALDIAKITVKESVSLEPSRLYPRALLGLASVHFFKGEYRTAARLDELVLDFSQSSHYRPLAAFSMAAAVAQFDGLRALTILKENQSTLDQLPLHRQVQRYWSLARVLVKLERTTDAVLAYKTAIVAAPDRCDARDLFLIFDELRRLIGTKDPRLVPLAVVLQ